MAMSTTELLHMMDEMQRTNRQKVEEWLKQGKTDVSPREAAQVLGMKNAYALNVGAKEHPQPGMYWRGRNLRISVRYILNYLEARA